MGHPADWPTAPTRNNYTMRLITIFILFVLTLPVCAQPCTQGEGLITVEIANGPYYCLSYETKMEMANGELYIVVLSVAADSVTLARALGKRFLGRKRWARYSEQSLRLAVNAYNDYINIIKRRHRKR
jgi:hypothetical protein